MFLLWTKKKKVSLDRLICSFSSLWKYLTILNELNQFYLSQTLLFGAISLGVTNKKKEFCLEGSDILAT